MSKAVFCTVKGVPEAAEVVDRLKMSGFDRGDISVLIGDKTGTRDFAIENETKAPEGAATGASAGALVGGGLGWLAGAGALAIPGLGPLIAAGPILAALSGAAIGGAVGGIAGALVGMGIPEYEAERYESHIKAGNALIAVHCENADEVSCVKELFEEAGAENVSTASESSNVRS